MAGRSEMDEGGVELELGRRGAVRRLRRHHVAMRMDSKNASGASVTAWRLA